MDIKQNKSDDPMKIGVLGDAHAMGVLEFQVKRSLTIKNCVADAVESLNISASANGNIRLELEKDREWFNNPYPSLFAQFIKHNTSVIQNSTDILSDHNQNGNVRKSELVEKPITRLPAG